MKRLFIASLLVAQFLISEERPLAYEVLTHQAMSAEALEASILATDSSLLPDLGLQLLSKKQTFFDATLLRNATISEMIQRGAEQEDNARGSRFVHHFYDPVYNAPLNPILLHEKAFLTTNYGWLTNPLKSPDWALEDNEEIDVQRFSFKDARRGFFDALTKNTKEERDRAISFTFRTLGHVIHHIQDMAQPQHTKNEKHPLEPASLYEHFTERQDIREALPYSGYNPVFSPEPGKDHTTFNTARKFWTTGTGGDGKGLAEFTNWNFVTYGHNFTGLLNEIQRDPRYPHPDGIGAQVWAENVHIVPQVAINNNLPSALLGKVYYIRKPVYDKYLNTTEINDRASTFSLYDVDLQQFHLKVPSCTGIPTPCETEAIFSVNRSTIRAAHQFLIPRAVAYSAGLINYFFRGKIDVVDETPGQHVIKNMGTELLKGTFTLYYDDNDGNRHPVVPDPNDTTKATPWPTPAQGLAAGSTMPLPAFAPPVTPTPKTAGEYMLVFQGDMGEEKTIAVAASIVEIDVCPSIFFTPAGRLTYTRSEGWQHQAESPLAYGNTDWQGNDCRSLSWLGPLGRYLHTLPVSLLSPSIASNGRILATAPGPVVGAAIQQHPQTHELFLIAVVAEVDGEGKVSADHAYARALTNLATTSWTSLGTFTYPADYPNDIPVKTATPAHYFFNASGTQAVSVKLSPGEARVRHVMLDVDVTQMTGTFSLAAVRPPEMSSSETPYFCENCTGTKTTRNRIFGVAADYVGDLLVEVDLLAASDAHYQNQFAGASPNYTYGVHNEYDDLQSLSSSLGWNFVVYRSHYVYDEDGTFADNYYPSISIYQSDSPLKRGLVYLDLRFVPPVVVSEEYQDSWTLTSRGYTDPGPSFHYNETSSTSTGSPQERLILQLQDATVPVTEWRSAPISDRLFVLSFYPAFSDTAYEPLGTFAVGGTASSPRIVGAYANPRTQVNFMMPPGDLNAYGGGPVGR